MTCSETSGSEVPEAWLHSSPPPQTHTVLSPATHPTGAPLQLGDTPASRKLSSSPLTLSISDVLSDKADELTDGRWASSLGLPDDSYLEVPPDGGSGQVRPALGARAGGSQGAQ